MTKKELMQAVEITEPGGPNVLRLTTAPVPEISETEVLIEVHAAGVNRPDCMQRAGKYPLPPGASPFPGLEVSGVVAKTGARVERWRPGDQVVALTHGGGYAEFCCADEGHCLPWPTELSDVEAAALPETTFTVRSNLFGRAHLAADESLLVHGGSSGIGTTAIQLARAAGATVITTAGSDEKCAFCKKLGADFAINYRTDDWAAQTMDITSGKGVNCVLDMVAGDYVERNLQVLALDGRYAMIAFLHGPKVEVNFVSVLTKRLTITGSTLRPQSVEQKRAIARDVEEHVWPLVVSGALRAPIHQVYSLGEAAAAHEMMESSTHLGKLVLRVARD